MKLFINVIDGVPNEHPAYEENLLQAFPEGIPSTFEPFERTPIDRNFTPTSLQKITCTYVKNENGVWRDLWQVEELAGLEREAKITQLTSQVNETLSRMKLNTQNAISKCMEHSDLSGLAAWSDFLDKLNAWQLISVAPLSPELPAFPKRNAEGLWVSGTDIYAT